MADNTLNINAKSVLKYTLLPGILPRARELGTSGFGYLAFLFASVYRAVRILPENHRFTQPENIGKFTIAQVIAAAANNVEVRRGNIDQILVFIALLIAVILMFLQFVLLILGLVTGRAFAQTGAQGGAFTSMFQTQNPQTDIAFLMLDYVFGIPAVGGQAGSSFFGSKALEATNGPTPFQLGMHSLFNFYNLAILLVAALIFMYYIFVVVIETAKTGVPFGHRFAKLYAPFRLVFAIGLLVPLYSGFNAAQYITLTAAKMGSSFATNGWILYNKTLKNPMGIENASLIAKPVTPIVDGLVHFAAVYHACREIYGIWDGKDDQNPSSGTTCIKAYVVIDGKATEFVSNTSKACEGKSPDTDNVGGALSYTKAKEYFGKSDMEIILGEYDADKWKGYAGGVKPLCGKLTVALGSDNPASFKNQERQGDENGSQTNSAQGVRDIERGHFMLVTDLLRTSKGLGGTSTSAYPEIAALGERVAHALVPTKSKELGHDTCHASDVLGDSDRCGKVNEWKPPLSVFQKTYSAVRQAYETTTNRAHQDLQNGLTMKLDTELERRGWGGAGIWYNNIADMNGSFTGAIYAAPSVRKLPDIMEKVKRQKQAQDKNTTSCEAYTPNLARNQDIELAPKELVMAGVMNEAYKYFNCFDGSRNAGGPKPNESLTPNAFLQGIGMVFGVNGLFDLHKAAVINEATGQSTIHPLAQLSTIGKSLVENAMRSMGMAMIASGLGGFASGLGLHVGEAVTAAGSMLVGIATIGLTAGFLLYYILPFLPFIYFFFAVASWVKSIFEAMVGVPLWALAHLHIDGDGFSGRAAFGGYFLIFEIFLRPIVTLFGLIGGIAVFGALAAIMNSIFDLVIVNITGALPGENTGASVNMGAVTTFRRGVLDQFFFTIMYAILIYMMANASFKMIDTIPQAFMRWIGSGVSTFNDNKGDPAGNLTQYAAIGGSTMAGKIMGGLNQGSGALGQAGGGLLKSMQGETK